MSQGGDGPRGLAPFPSRRAVNGPSTSQPGRTRPSQPRHEHRPPATQLAVRPPPRVAKRQGSDQKEPRQITSSGPPVGLARKERDELAMRKMIERLDPAAAAATRRSKRTRKERDLFAGPSADPVREVSLLEKFHSALSPSKMSVGVDFEFYLQDDRAHQSANQFLTSLCRMYNEKWPVRRPRMVISTDPDSSVGLYQWAVSYRQRLLLPTNSHCCKTTLFLTGC